MIEETKILKSDSRASSGRGHPLVRHCVCICLIVGLTAFLYWALDVPTSDPPQILRTIKRGAALAIFALGFTLINKWAWRF